MIKNPSDYASFKRRAISSETLTLDEKYRILEALYEEARRLGMFGGADILLGLDADIRLAAALNGHVPTPPR